MCKLLNFKSFISILVLIAFLVLGFCPLRNTLCKLINSSSPARHQQRVPEYGKISAADKCGSVAVVKALPLKERVFDGAPLLFFVVLVGTFLVAGLRFDDAFTGNLAISHHRYLAVPIYLRNQILRI